MQIDTAIRLLLGACLLALIVLGILDAPGAARVALAASVLLLGVVAAIRHSARR